MHLLGLAALMLLGHAAFAQDSVQSYPSKPVKVILTFPAGGDVDVIARALAQKLSDSTGQPLVVLTAPTAYIVTTCDLIAKAKANPNAINFGSGGNGSSGHLVAEHLASMAGVTMSHVPYKGGPQVLTDLAGGQR